MHQNRLGPTDLFVSEIGLGAMSLGDDDQENERLLQRAVELGITFFDTADLYARGANERALGQALKGVRDQVVIATKGGNRWHEGEEGWHWDPSPAYIKQAARASLQRLGVEVIDLYQMHGGTLDDPMDDTIGALEELKREGVIRHYGISSIRPNVIRKWVKRSNMVSVMMQYSLLDRRPEETVLELLQRENISVIARGPVAKGILSDQAGEKLNRTYLDYTPAGLQDIHQKLEPYTTPQRSRAQLALRYALAHPAVATVIPGASHQAQLEENAATAQAPSLTDSELHDLRQLTRANTYEKHR